MNEDPLQNWNSELATELRKSVLDGSYSMCSHTICPSLNLLKNSEEIHKTHTIPGPGVNFMSREYFKYTFGINKVDELAKFDKLPSRLTLSFDQSCNLKCPSCRNSIVPNDDVDSEQYKIKKNILDIPCTI